MIYVGGDREKEKYNKRGNKVQQKHKTRQKRNIWGQGGVRGQGLGFQEYDKVS